MNHLLHLLYLGIIDYLLHCLLDRHNSGHFYHSLHDLFDNLRHLHDFLIDLEHLQDIINGH